MTFRVFSVAWIVILAALFLAACTAAVQEEAVRSLAGDAQEERADQAVEALFSRDGEAIRALSHPDAISYYEDDALAPVFDILPTTPPSEIILAQYASGTVLDRGMQVTNSELTYLVFFEEDESGIERASVRIRLQAVDDGPHHLLHLNFQDRTIGEGASQTLMTTIVIGLAIGVAGFCLVTLLVAIFTPRLKRRILWSLFILLVGMPVFQFTTPGETWTYLGPGPSWDGEMFRFQIFLIRVFSASFVSDLITGYSAYDIAAPLGALAFWFQRLTGRLARKPQPETRIAEEAAAQPRASETDVKPASDAKD